MSARTATATGLAGLASFALIMVAAFVVAPPLWQAPRTMSSAIQVADYAHRESGATTTSLFIYSIAFGLFTCFAAGLWVCLRQTEPQPHPLSAIYAFGAVTLVVLIFAAFATGGVLSYRPWEPSVALALRDVTFGLLAISGIPTAVCLAAYALIALKNGGLPTWTGWIAIAGTIAHVLITASFISHTGPLSLEGFIVVLAPGTFFPWILATSIGLLLTISRQ